MMGEMVLAGREAPFGVRDFGSWMTAEQRRVHGLCFRLLGDSEEADSAAQDAFLKAYRALENGAVGELDDPGKWITRIAVNTCLDRLRSRKWQFWRKRPNPEDERTILDMAAETGPDAERQAYAAQINQRIARALEKLSDRQRAVFTLRHFEDLPLEQIASTLDLDLGTVKAHMFRAVRKMREELRDLYAGAEASQQ